MAFTRSRSLEAALAILGEDGIRALSHARVDERAGLPKGSTSNWFRTRDALVEGVVHALAEAERADFATAPEFDVRTPADLIDGLCVAIQIQSGPLASRTRARYALFLEGAGSPDLLAPLIEQRRVFVEWTTDLLARIGAPDPSDAVRTLMAAGDGLILHRVTIDPDAPIRPVIERAVQSCLL